MGGVDTQLAKNVLRQTGLPRKPRGRQAEAATEYRREQTAEDLGEVDMGSGYERPSSDPRSSLSKLKKAHLVTSPART